MTNTRLFTRPLAAVALSCALLAPALADSVRYEFTTGNVPVGDPILAPYFGGMSVSGSFWYDAGTADGGALANGATLYPGSVTDMIGTVDGLAFSDPVGLIVVGDDRFFGVTQGDGVVYAADPNADSGAPASFFNLSGFDIADYTLVNVRLFWLESITGADFLSDQLAPDPLPGFVGRLALDFAAVVDPEDRRSVFFNDLQLMGRVGIDIKPGSDPNCFNVNGHGVIPVAILGSSSFDVTQIDTASLRFSGLAVRVRGNNGAMCQLDYSNDDDALDLVCQFEDDADNWNAGTSEATVEGSLLNGTRFEGTDSICVVP